MAAMDRRYVLVHAEAARGAAVPLHVHRHATRYLLLVDGELDVRRDGERVRLTAPDACAVPSGIPHALTVASEHARFVVVCDPSAEPAVRALAGDPPLEPDDLAAVLAAADVTLL
jgi:quercetin dioxygenase-like cupin family protein